MPAVMERAAPAETYMKPGTKSNLREKKKKSHRFWRGAFLHSSLSNRYYLIMKRDPFSKFTAQVHQINNEINVALH